MLLPQASANRRLPPTPRPNSTWPFQSLCALEIGREQRQGTARLMARRAAAAPSVEKLCAAGGAYICYCCRREKE